MPKTELSKEVRRIELANRSLVGSLRYQEEFCEHGMAGMAALAGITERRYGDILKMYPDTLKLCQLRKLLKHASDAELLAAFGRGELIESRLK